LGCDNLSFSSDLLNQILQEAVEKGTDRTFQTEPYFVHHNDIQVSNLAIEMAEEKFKLSESQQVKDDEESLRNRVKHLMLDFRRDYVEKHLVAIKAQIAQAHGDQQMALMAEYQKLIAQRNKLAKELGSNIIV
jgi:DNA primase